MKWLEDNPVGLALSAFCGVLLFILLLLAVLSALPVNSELASDAADEDDGVLELPQLSETPPIDTFSVITQRPLFNENRLPSDDGADAQTQEAPVVAEVDAPDVVLSGVIITPTLRMVTLRRKDTAKSLVAFEGQPIEADFGSWQVSQVGERTAMLTSGAGEELLLELKVHDEAIALPDVPVSRPVASDSGDEASAEAGAASDAEPLTRAEEIRQRIAERREELRREAEAMEQSGEEAQPGYRNAIQSMIGRNRRDPSNNEKEQ